MVVVVAADGIPDGLVPSGAVARQFPMNRAQGEAMWTGVYEALRKSPRLAALSDQIELRKYDDWGVPANAQLIANMVVEDPPVVAVIGHATSATTRAAAATYAKAGIPLLMPIATSPYALIPPGKDDIPGNRLPDCYQLPPSDLLAQAPAVAYVVRQLLRSKHCAVIGDDSSGARDYSQPLFTRVVALIEPLVVDKRLVNWQLDDFLTVASNISSQPYNAIVFCGYGSTAIKLLTSLRVAYSDVPLDKRPTLVLTDGCLVPDIDLSGFETYLTFPAPSADALSDNVLGTADGTLLKELLQKEGATQSYCTYGYDAMLFLGDAILRAQDKGPVSRRSIAAALQQQMLVNGAFLTYTFNNGQNMNTTYYLYRSPPGATKRANDFVFFRTLTQDELRQFSSPMTTP